LDGRRPREIRRLHAELGVLNGPDGSAAFEMGNTKVLAAVFGPRPVGKRADELPDRAAVRCEFLQAPFSTGERRWRGKGERRNVEVASLVRDAVSAIVQVDLFARSQIDVHVQVVQADGGLRSCALNAAFLALADAGIPCKDVMAATGAGLLEGTAVLDMNGQEDMAGGPEITMAFSPGSEDVVAMASDNKILLDNVEGVMDLAAEGCRAVARFMADVLRQHTVRRALASGALATAVGAAA